RNGDADQPEQRRGQPEGAEDAPTVGVLDIGLQQRVKGSTDANREGTDGENEDIGEQDTRKKRRIVEERQVEQPKDDGADAEQLPGFDARRDPANQRTAD